MKNISLFFVVLLFSFPVWAEIKVEEVVSDSGISFWLLKDQTVPVISMDFAFEGGISGETPEKSGLTNLLSQSLTQGVKADSKTGQPALNETTFQEQLNDLSIKLHFRNGRDYFYGQLKTLKEHHEQAGNFLRRTLTAPLFDEQSLTRQKQRIVASIKQDQANPNWLMWRNFNAVYYEGHPYSLPGQGTISTVLSLKSEMLEQYRKKYFVQKGLSAVIVGDITTQEAKDWVDTIFGALPKDLLTKETPIKGATASGLGSTQTIFFESPQTTILMGRPGLSNKSAQWPAALVANYLLGGGGFSSVLMEELRAKRGLTYGVSSMLFNQQHSDVFVISLSTQSDKTQEVLEIIKQTLIKVREEGFSSKQVDNAKTYLIGSQPLALTSSDKISSVLLEQKLDGFSKEYINLRPELIDKVTVEQVSSVIDSILASSSFLTVMVGPLDKNQRPK